MSDKRLRTAPCRSPRAFTAAFCAAALFASACASHSHEVFVPLEKSAKQQYAYAAGMRERNMLVLHNKDHVAKMRDARNTLQQALMKVVEYYPEDREFTPLARLDLADMTAALDTEFWRASNGEYKAAIKEFQKIQADYPESEYVQARARFREAICWKDIKDFAKAQSLFKDVEEAYGQNKDKEILKIAVLARHYYQQTYIK